MRDTINVRGVEHVRVSGGDAADASWEKGRIQGMGFSPVVREVEEDSYGVYLPVSEAKAYERALRGDEEAYWHSSEGIAEMKSYGQSEPGREYLRSPGGRFDTHQYKLMERAMRRGEYD